MDEAVSYVVLDYHHTRRFLPSLARKIFPFEMTCITAVRGGSRIFFIPEYRHMRRFLSFLHIVGDEFLSFSHFSICLAFSLRESSRQYETELVLF